MQPESLPVTGNPRNVLFYDAPYLQNEFGDPQFFFDVFNVILSFSTCSESFEKICVWELLGANVLKLLKFEQNNLDCNMVLSYDFHAVW